MALTMISFQIRHGFSKIIIIRNIKKQQNEIDAVILRCENNLKQQNYLQVLDGLNAVEETYKESLKTLLKT